ncbi:MAG: HEAT repeat domain-containing protein [Gemmatimonadales bacterium]
MRSAALIILAVSVPLAEAEAQDATRRFASVRDGAAHLSFAVRGRTCWSNHGRMTDDDCPCGPGVAHATVSLASGRVTGFRMKVGRADAAAPAHDGSGVELGRVPAPEAAELLLALAARQGEDGEDLVAAASVADSAVVWPRLLELARSGSLERPTRRAAVFWLSQAADDAATRGLDSIVADPTGDRDLREHAVFALSQRPQDEAVPALIRIARGHGDGAIRRKAVFWLGQTDDPRAVALFEDILRR